MLLDSFKTIRNILNGILKQYLKAKALVLCVLLLKRCRRNLNDLHTFLDLLSNISILKDAKEKIIIKTNRINSVRICKPGPTIRRYNESLTLTNNICNFTNRIKISIHLYL